MRRLLLAGLLLGVMLTQTTQAEFFQCPPYCVGSDDDDLVNGSDAENSMEGGFGNDLMFGGDGRDQMSGGPDDDLMFGGLESDVMNGGPGDDTLLPGPDGTTNTQSSNGDQGDDTFNVLVDKTSNCQFIYGGPGYDVLNLIGFGQFMAEYPYGQTEPIARVTFLVIQDPAAGGYIFVQIEEGSGSLERINGLPSPNVTVLGNTAAGMFFNQNCNLTT
jgi:hypothetical protein